ncbi:MAG: HIT domain-containing protein [Rhodobiaceae bacterium]|nr:HIT domain-containing protein [Rhodobiaceae bacterium]
MPIFALDPRLAADTLPVAELGLCSLRLMNDAGYPWLILVPRRAGLADLIDLEPADRATLAAEVDAVSCALKAHTGCHKLNVAALGNVVRQLHVHVIARFETDPAWPAPVWGKAPAKPYAPRAGEAFAAALSAAILGN